MGTGSSKPSEAQLNQQSLIQKKKWLEYKSDQSLKNTLSLYKAISINIFPYVCAFSASSVALLFASTRRKYQIRPATWFSVSVLSGLVNYWVYNLGYGNGVNELYNLKKEHFDNFELE
eukprot:TRINITY_DN4306_c0_g1_i1.p1 TRINITY_DN4306_c0_g1~~TRINITY_DN4306_c0_g1_i1.p1  ORF type:complete len:118 (+),score=15.11 TRINITY_DN4306_c0_g1_i1:66-419(+)